MTNTMDIQALLAPIPGDNPAGADMRYLPLYDEIKEARRADDMLDRGDWERELKTADWGQVISLSVDALMTKTKDLMIASWLLEALIRTRGFDGVEAGLTVLIGLVDGFWDNVYPLIEDGDLEYRCGPLEFINDKLSSSLREIPLTDPGTTPGYSWLRWQESTIVGRETDTLNQWGDIDEKKKQNRDHLIDDGKLTAEEFEKAVLSSDRHFYERLMTTINACLELFGQLDKLLDEKFGDEAPKISDFHTALSDCSLQVGKILKEKRKADPDAVPDEDPDGDEKSPERPVQPDVSMAKTEMSIRNETVDTAAVLAGEVSVNRLLGSGGLEESRWREAQTRLKQSGIESAVEFLLGAACSAQSPRERANYHLLIARLCLQVERVDLARPLVEQLFVQMEDLQLVRWESPIWIAEVLDVLYRCLTAEGAPDEDQYRAKEILNRLCTTDITKAMKYRR